MNDARSYNRHKRSVVIAPYLWSLMRGTIKWYSIDKGFGFIVDEAGEDRFFSARELHDGYLPKELESVCFDPAIGAKGPRARRVRKDPDGATERSLNRAEQVAIVQRLVTRVQHTLSRRWGIKGTELSYQLQVLTSAFVWAVPKGSIETIRQLQFEQGKLLGDETYRVAEFADFVRKCEQVIDEELLRCRKCKGTGRIHDYDPLFALATFGLSAALKGEEPCPSCQGLGRHKS